ncbi:hypothetical protein BGZ61DRAFT_570292, partial [Ilyonectria robusta]|uniref:uncharacterized protein n=1 Tax=Ilyonectria robusta TaxID=1079257 RepID=UPI001E8CE165
LADRSDTAGTNAVLRSIIIIIQKRNRATKESPTWKPCDLPSAWGHRCREGSSKMNSPVAKPNEIVARAGACLRSAGNGVDGNDASVSERGQGDDTVGSGVDVVAAAEAEHTARHGRFGRLSTYESPASAASKFRPILSKQPVVEETVWRQHAEAIARSLPKRPLRGGLRSSGARKSHHTVKSGGSAQHQPPSQLQRPFLPRERGGPEAADSDPLLFHRHFLPMERRDGDDERRGMASVGDPALFRRNEAPTVRLIQPKQPVSEDIRRSELASAIARGLPKRRRRGGRRPLKARPDTSGQDLLPSRDEPPRKQIRAGIRRQRRRELQAEDLMSVLRFLEEDFAMKESLSNEQTWCTPVPYDRTVSTVRDFYQAFHDVSTLPIRTCMLCYRGRLAISMSKLLSCGRTYLRLCGVYALPEAGWPVASGPTSRPAWL